MTAWKRPCGVPFLGWAWAAELLRELSLDATGRHAGNKPALEGQED